MGGTRRDRRARDSLDAFAPAWLVHLGEPRHGIGHVFGSRQMHAVRQAAIRLVGMPTGVSVRSRLSLLGVILVAAVTAPHEAPAQARRPPDITVSRSGRSSASTNAERGDGYVRRDWTVASGLPQGSVNAIAVDASGFVWLATNGGLVRFDGRGLRTFDGDQIPALVSNRVAWVTPGDGASVIAATLEGNLVRLVAGRVEGPQPPPLAKALWSIQRDYAARLYATTENGVFRLDGSNRWSRVLIPTRTRTPGRLAFTGDASQLVIDDFGVIVIRPGGGWSRVPEPLVRAAIPDGEGSWVGGGRGLFWTSLDGLVRRRAPAPLDTTPITILARHPDGQLWIGASTGVWRLCITDACRRTGAQPEAIDTATETHRYVTAIAFPSSDVVVAGTQSQGFVTYTRRAIRRLPVPAGFGGVSVHHLVTTADGTLWSAPSSCTGIRRARGDSTLLFARVRLRLRPDCIHGLVRARDGTLYIGEGGALSHLRDDGTTLAQYTMADGMTASGIGPIFEDRSGRIWFGTQQGQVAFLNARGAVVFDSVLTLPNMPVWSIAQDSSGTLWIGGVGQLRSRIVRGELRTYGAADGAPRGQVRVLEADPDGTLWIAAYGGGLTAFRDGHMIAIPASAGIRERSFSSLVPDRRGRFWLSGNAGITSLVAADLRAFVRGETNAVDASVIGPDEDVPEGNGGHPAAAVLSDGRIAFATVAGVVLVDPDSLALTSSPLLVDEIRVADVPQSPTSRVIHGNSGEPLLVRFAAPNFGRNGTAQYRVRLSSEGDAWRELGPDLSLRYAGLSSGSYDLLVRVPAGPGGTIHAEQLLTIVIEPRWFETTVARLLALLLSLTALVAFLIAHQRDVRKRLSEEISALEVRRLADEERARYQSELAHVARRATAGELATSLAHEVGQPLTAMVGNAEAGRRLLTHALPDLPLIDTVLSDIVREGRRAANVIRELRSFLRRGQPNQQQLDLSAKAAECLVLIRSEFEDAGVRLTTELAPDLPPVLGEPVLLQQVVLNLLTNAADALRPLPPGERLVHLRVRTSHAGVRLTVSDSGMGVPADMRRRIFEAFHTTKSDGMGVGLAICRTIIDAHHGRLQVRAGPTGGAVFSFVLPLVVTAQ